MTKRKPARERIGAATDMPPKGKPRVTLGHEDMQRRLDKIIDDAFRLAIDLEDFEEMLAKRERRRRKSSD